MRGCIDREFTETDWTVEHTRMITRSTNVPLSQAVQSCVLTYLYHIYLKFNSICSHVCGERKTS